MFDRLKQVPIASVLKDLALCLDTAEKQVKSSEDKRIAEAVTFGAKEGLLDSVALIRSKEMEIRSSDEKQFLGIDAVLHPERYCGQLTKRLLLFSFQALIYWHFMNDLMYLC